MVAGVEHGDATDPSLLAAAISVVAATGDEDDFELFHTRFGAAATPQDELRYLYALAGFDHAELVDRIVAAHADRRGPQPERALRAAPGP